MTPEDVIAAVDELIAHEAARSGVRASTVELRDALVDEGAGLPEDVCVDLVAYLQERLAG